MSETVSDERVARYVALVKDGKDAEADALLRDINSDVHQRFAVLSERQEVVQGLATLVKIRAPRVSFTKTYNELKSLYRDAVHLSKWASATKKAMREAKRVRDADIVTEEQR
jgi:hypothetical protein